MSARVYLPLRSIAIAVSVLLPSRFDEQAREIDGVGSACIDGDTVRAARHPDASEAVALDADRLRDDHATVTARVERIDLATRYDRVVSMWNVRQGRWIAPKGNTRASHFGA